MVHRNFVDILTTFTPRRYLCFPYKDFFLEAFVDQSIYFIIKIKYDSLRKQAYSNILKILPPKNENFQIKNSNIFHITAQNIDCGYSLEPTRRGGSNEYPQSMFFEQK